MKRDEEQIARAGTPVLRANVRTTADPEIDYPAAVDSPTVFPARFVNATFPRSQGEQEIGGSVSARDLLLWHPTYLEAGSDIGAVQINNRWFSVTAQEDGQNVWRCDADGVLLWTKLLSPGAPSGIACDAELNTIVALNDAAGSLYKLDPAGAQLWRVEIPRLQRVVVDDEDNIYTINTAGSIGSFQTRLTSYDPAGELRWETTSNNNWAVDLDWGYNASAADDPNQYRILCVVGFNSDDDPTAGKGGNIRTFRADDGTFLQAARGQVDVLSGDVKTIYCVAALQRSPATTWRTGFWAGGQSHTTNTGGANFVTSERNIIPEYLGTLSSFPHFGRANDTFAIDDWVGGNSQRLSAGNAAAITNSLPADDGPNVSTFLAQTTLDEFYALHTGGGATVRDMHYYGEAAQKVAICQNTVNNLQMLTLPLAAAPSALWTRSLYLNSAETELAFLTCCAGGSDGSVVTAGT